MSTQIVLPNIRKLFIADPGHVMYECDLAGADAQVVAWEADDADLKAAFRNGLDVHSHNAEAMWGAEFTRLPSGSNARRQKRQLCKRGVHLTNYGGTARGMAQALGLLVIEAERFQRRWFSIHPGINKGWHERTRRQLADNRTINNAFGFRRVFFDRPDVCFTEALAWIPQSTVAINVNKGARQLTARYWPEQLAWNWFPSPGHTEGILLQTHDSINPQFRLSTSPTVEALKETLAVVTPYPDPLVIPWDIKRSTKSWGEMEKC